MVYSDKGSRGFMIIVVILALAALVYGLWGSRIAEFIRTQNLLTQITPISQDDQNYLLNLSGLAFLEADEVADEEALQQRFANTLFDHVDEFDETDDAAAELYLKDYYAMTEPIPISVQDSVLTSAEYFVERFAIIGTASNTLLNDLLTILANHQVATNNYQSVRRAQTTRAFLDAVIKQL